MLFFNTQSDIFINMVSKNQTIGLFIFGVIFMFSCTVSKNFKHYVYLADSIKANHLSVQLYQIPKLRIGDRLQITVTALNTQAAQAFNQTYVNISNLSNGYLINNSGNIQFPQIGNVKVEGLTTDSVEKVLENKLVEYLNNPVVTCNQINFNINLIGEISKPGIVNVQDGKMTIIEAIARGGDLTLYGKRENVLVIREKDGKREFGRVDLTSNNVFNSPYYYLEQGDVVYVDVNENKLLGADVLQQKRLTMITVVLSVFSALLVIKAYLKI